MQILCHRGHLSNKKAPGETSEATMGEPRITRVPSLSRIEALIYKWVDLTVTLEGSLTKIMEHSAGNEQTTLGIWKKAINHQ